MPKVASIRIDGYDLRFMSHDHMPPHFHWEKAGSWAVRVNFTRGGAETFASIYGPGPNGSEQKEMRQLIESHLAELLKEWEAKVKVSERLQKAGDAR